MPRTWRRTWPIWSGDSSAWTTGRSRRRYIPKPGGAKQRPLGIPTLEDKLVQAGLVRILESIYEQDFVEASYGFRPGRGCHDALRVLSRSVRGGFTHHIVEADIKGFFDSVDHEWMMKFLEHRIRDQRVLRMVKRFLKAGVVEEDKVEASEEGTLQGGVISPLLANVYLHYVLDLWFERRLRRSCAGQARLIRYADDFVVCFEKKHDAEEFRAQLAVRLKQFGLEVEPTKTKVLEFGPRAAEEARRQARKKPETFDFLGFTHYCSRSRDGKRFRMKRTTVSKRVRVKLAAYKAWLKASRARMCNRELWERTCQMLRGHYAYYGVTDNYRAIDRFGFQVRRILFKWLNRQGGRRPMNWEQFNLMAERFPFPRPRIRVNLISHG